MALEFEFPDTGEGVTEGTFLEWLVEEAEEVEEDQTVAEVETDKAVVDVPAPVSGTVKELKAEPGDTVEVGEVIMIMEEGETEAENTGGEDSEDQEEVGEDGGEEEAPEEEQSDGEVEDREEKEASGMEKKDENDAGPNDVLALPKVRKLARENGIDLSRIDGSGENGRIREEDLEDATGGETEVEQEESTEEPDTGEPEDTKEEKTDTSADVKATPSVRKLAREKGVEIAAIDGSGRGGNITRDDVLEAAEGEEEEETGEKEREQEPKKQKAREAEESGKVERVKMSGIRKATAEKMAESRFTAPHVTHVEKADVTDLMELRDEKKEKVDVHLTYLPFIIKACLLSLDKYPDLNAELDEENDEIIRKKYYNFNIAVDTEHGLMTPKIEDIDGKSIVDLASEISEKAEAAKERELSREELEPGTFALTNLGVIGGEEFTPIIEYPQVAILGIGRISETAEVVNGKVRPRTTVKLSLSYDHRVVDGATAARFMNEVVENLENPEEMLMEI